IFRPIRYNVWVPDSQFGFLQFGPPRAIGARPPGNSRLIFQLCARSPCRRFAWSTPRGSRSASGTEVFATSRCARRDGAGTLRASIACGRGQRVRRRTEKSATKPFPLLVAQTLFCSVARALLFSCLWHLVWVAVVQAVFVEPPHR